MERRRACVWVALSLAVVAAGPAFAASLIDVTAVVENVFAGPDGAPVAQLEWGVRNLTADTAVSVNLQAYVEYPSGLRQLVFPPQVVDLGPGDARINLAFVIVPDRAGVGTATFHADARTQRVDGSSGDLVSDTDTFEVPQGP